MRATNLPIVQFLVLCGYLGATGCGQDEPGKTDEQADTAAADAGNEADGTADDGSGDDAGDDAGASADAAKTYEPPTVTFDKPADGAVVKGLVEVLVQATADKQVKLQKVVFDLDGSALETVTKPPFSMSLDTDKQPEGERVLGATAFDDAGQNHRETVKITVDRSGPAMSFSQPADSAAVDGDTAPAVIEVGFKDAADVSGTVAFSALRGEEIKVIGTRNAAPWQVQWDTKGLASSKWTLQVIANDPYGNATKLTRDVVLDRPPTIAWVAPLNHAKVSGMVTLTAKGEDDVALKALAFLVDGKPIAEHPVAGTSAQATSLWDSTTVSAGSHMVTARATDKAGRTQQLDITLTVDQPPVATLLGCAGKDLKICGPLPTPPASISGTRKLVVELTDDDATIKSAALKLDGKELIKLEKPPFEHVWDTTTATEGKHTLAATVITSKDHTLELSHEVTVNNCDKDGDGHKADSKACGGDDCDDINPKVYTGAPDPLGDGVDQGCDGKDGTDKDGDGWFALGSGGKDGDADCDDDDATVHPCADDMAGDNVDSNCDGKDDGSCDDCDSCSVDSLSSGACVHIAFGEGGSCDDGNACSSGDVCKAGKCTPTQTKTCDDANLCTLDSCDTKLACVHQAHTGPCEDGDICTLSKCVAGACTTQSTTACDDGVACSDDKCDPKTGCFAVTSADGTGCASGCKFGKCKAGKCDATVDGLWSKTAAGIGVALAAVPVGDGDYLVPLVGENINTSKPTVLRVDGGGKQVWSKDVISGAGAFLDGVPDGSGGVWLAGGTQQGVATLVGLCVRLDADGKLLQEVAISAAQTLFTIGRSDDGKLMVGGSPGVGVGGPALVGLSADGKVTWTKAVVTGGNDLGVLNLANMGKSSVIGVGFKSQSEALVFEATYDGAITWAQGVKPQKSGLAAILYGIAEQAGDWLAAGMSMDSSGQLAGWVVGLDNKGKVLWQRNEAGAGMIFDVTAGDAGFLLTGSTSDPGKGDAFIAKLGAGGATVWSHTYKSLSGSGSAWLTRARLMTGGWLALGETNATKTGLGEPWLIRVDAFGHPTCSEAGKCAGKTVESCADANPCTLDSCAGATGCTHVNAADGLVCGVAKNCSAGVCL